MLGGRMPEGWSMKRARKVEAEVYAKRGIAEGNARRLSDKDLLEIRDRLIEQNKGPKRSLRAALTYKPKTYGSGAMRERLIREYAQQKISREIVEVEIKRRKL
jgi:hypothetical protein